MSDQVLYIGIENVAAGQPVRFYASSTGPELTNGEIDIDTASTNIELYQYGSPTWTFRRLEVNEVETKPVLPDNPALHTVADPPANHSYSFTYLPSAPSQCFTIDPNTGITDTAIVFTDTKGLEQQDRYFEYTVFITDGKSCYRFDPAIINKRIRG